MKAACLLMLAGTAACCAAPEAAVELFRPPGMSAWDFWFAKQGDTYHAFYLQAPTGVQRAVGFSNVGHATSKDLVRWTDHGPALVPEEGSWNDKHIATGSVAAHAGKWWMVYTGYGHKQSGVGLAVSDDLMRWTRVGNAPVAPLGQRFDAAWQGKPVKWYALADPYLYPEPIDGWYTMVLNSGIDGATGYARGCITTMRSRDMQTWEPGTVLAWPEWFDRMETPQVWQRNGRWYLYFGAAHDSGVNERFVREAALLGPERVKRKRDNFVFTAERFEGPYRPAGRWWIDLPDGEWGYIMKVLPAPDGKDVMLSSVRGCLSRAYPVTYAADGSPVIGKPTP